MLDAEKHERNDERVGQTNARRTSAYADCKFRQATVGAVESCPDND